MILKPSKGCLAVVLGLEHYAFTVNYYPFNWSDQEALAATKLFGLWHGSARGMILHCVNASSSFQVFRGWEQRGEGWSRQINSICARARGHEDRRPRRRRAAAKAAANFEAGVPGRLAPRGRRHSRSLASLSRVLDRLSTEPNVVFNWFIFPKANYCKFLWLLNLHFQPRAG